MKRQVCIDRFVSEIWKWFGVHKRDLPWRDLRYDTNVGKRVINIKGIQTLVAFQGEGRPVLCLHGWDANHEAFKEVREALINDPVQVIVPDLPGFGDSADPPQAWSVDDYADFVDELVRVLELRDVLLVGHSFGGRIAIKLASRHASPFDSTHSVRSAQDDMLSMTPWISSMYLCGAAGIRQTKYIKRTIGIFLAETGRLIFRIPGLKRFEKYARKALYKILRVHDYEKTKGVIRETMIKVINEDLTPLLEMIDVPVDLFWGEGDRYTPLAHGKLMNKKIAQSTLHTYPGVRHGVHHHKAEEIAVEIRKGF
jgi:pimeloyl-ACP methyl ester carboxylesterase